MNHIIKKIIANIFDGLLYIGASLIAQLVKNPPAMQESPVQFLGREDLLEKGLAYSPVLLGFPCDSARPYFKSTPRAFLIAELVKSPPTMQETLVLFLGRDDLL